MSYKLDGHGLFLAVGGRKVIQSPIPDEIMRHAGSWAIGHPNKLEFHYQGGCGEDLRGVTIERGYPLVPLSVDSNGVVHQYFSIWTVGWHCMAVSEYAIGVEHEAKPGECELNDRQLASSAELFAALIDAVQHHFGFAIPVKHTGPVTPSNYRTVLGIADHLDVTPGSVLNPKRHVDKLYKWTHAQFYRETKRNLEASPVFPVFPGILRRGDEAPGVLVLKKRLLVLAYKGILLSPHFGKGTDRAVRSFQRKRKLTVDGIVGPLTWKELWQKS